MLLNDIQTEIESIFKEFPQLTNIAFIAGIGVETALNEKGSHKLHKNLLEAIKYLETLK